MKYDSKADTLRHIQRVSELLHDAADELLKRAKEHDRSKLESPEKELFDKFVPKLQNTTLGSVAYNELKQKMGVALEHHYAENSHHPQHYENGVNGFDLFDLIEMFFDWKAASERQRNGDVFKSLKISKEQGIISEQVFDILQNTAIRLS